MNTLYKSKFNNYKTLIIHYVSRYESYLLTYTLFILYAYTSRTFYIRELIKINFKEGIVTRKKKWWKKGEIKKSTYRDEAYLNLK